MVRLLQVSVQMYGAGEKKKYPGADYVEKNGRFFLCRNMKAIESGVRARSLKARKPGHLRIENGPESRSSGIRTTEASGPFACRVESCALTRRPEKSPKPMMFLADGAAFSVNGTDERQRGTLFEVRASDI